MTDEAKQRPRARRRLLRWILALVLVLLAAGWTWGWYRGADELNAYADRYLTRASKQGSRISCPNRRVTGFPFSLAMTCDSFSLQSDADGTKVDAGPLRSSLRLYWPNTLNLAMDGPLNVAGTGENGTFNADWRRLSAGLRFGFSGPRQLSLQTSGFSLKGTGAAAPIAADIGTLDMTLARVDAAATADPVDIRMEGNDIALKAGDGTVVPPFALSADLRLDNPPAPRGLHFDLVAWLRKHGLSGEFRHASFATPSGGRVELSGPFKLARNGLLSARARIAATDFDAIAGFLAEILRNRPDALDQLRQATAILAATGLGGSSETALTLVIDRGRVSAGIIPLGDIPPLF
jgi:hypothetical protein